MQDVASSIIITSVALALLQYFDNTMKSQVKDSKDKLRKVLELLPKQNSPPILKLRKDYDELVNSQGVSMGFPIVAIFVAGFIPLVTIGALNSVLGIFYPGPFDALRIAIKATDGLLAVTVIMAGLMTWSARAKVKKYTESVDTLFTHAEIADAVAQ